MEAALMDAMRLPSTGWCRASNQSK